MFEALVQAFLKAGGVDVEAEDLRRKGMLGGELFCAPDALLPGGIGHRAIMGLRLEACNRVAWRFILKESGFSV